MTPISKTLCAVLLSCGFAGSAVAATDTPQTGSTNNQSATSNTQAPAHVSQKLRNDLTKAGFSDITIMPSSFLVRAKDSDGNPVMMVINPDFITAVTAQTAPMKGASNSGTSSPNDQSNSSSPNAQSNGSASSPKSTTK